MAARVLIVDDEPNIVSSLEFLMRASGFEVASAGAAPAALELVRSFQPEVVLLDVMLPGENGFELCRRIRAELPGERLRIVMLSARGRADEQAQGRALGVDAYVLKPFSTREVVGLVRSLVA